MTQRQAQWRRLSTIIPLAYGATRETNFGANPRDPFDFDTKGRDWLLGSAFNQWLDNTNVRLVMGENTYLGLCNLFTRSLWTVDAVSLVVKATVRTTVEGAAQVTPRVYIRTIHGIRPYTDFPCSEFEQDTIDSDLACAILLAPVWPNQIVHSASGAVSYAMGVIHKRMRAVIHGGVVYDGYLKETPGNTPREWVRLDVWNEAFGTIWNLFGSCGVYRKEADPRSLFPKRMEHKGLCGHWCKAVCGFGKPENNAYAGHKVPDVLNDLELEFPQLQSFREDESNKADSIGDDDWWLLSHWMVNLLALPDPTPDERVPLRSKNGITHWFADSGDTYVNTPNMI